MNFTRHNDIQRHYANILNDFTFNHNTYNTLNIGDITYNDVQVFIYCYNLSRLKVKSVVSKVFLSLARCSFSITTLSLEGLFAILSINGTQPKQ